MTEEEIQKIVQFLQKQGRVSKTELAKECNRIIRLNPTGEVTLINRT